MLYVAVIEFIVNRELRRLKESNRKLATVQYCQERGYVL